MEPLPPVKEVEYRCIIGKMFDELSGQEFTTFSFETAKEFSSFRYEIAVRYKVTSTQLEFKVLGMTATRTMMPAFGTAKSLLKIPNFPFGVYNILMVKSDGTENMFSVEFTKRGFQVLQPVPRKRFIDIVIDPKAALPGAKHTSTVSKAPPVPLIPRTIQKRQPPPPTPEELAILESLKSETPEERDAREEMELFGGKKKVAKTDLAEAEQELKKLDDGKAAKPVAAPEPEKPKVSKHATTVSHAPKHYDKKVEHAKTVTIGKGKADRAIGISKTHTKTVAARPEAKSANGKSASAKAKPAAKPAAKKPAAKKK